MGIPGIYQEINPSKRVALVKLAIANYELTGRLLRMAVDTSIWIFQVRVAGGSPLRALYYRLLRLISVAIHPLFVFDGESNPPMKRDKPTAREASYVEKMFKQLIGYFGLSFHIAPGEAEAECALLQREGIVDAVLSEDVDTIMFGCGLTLRNWSPESSKGKVPTHVDVYDAQAAKEGISGLDPQGMILVALLSGGDYDTQGVPGFGAKIACQAARAGFGKSLCRISTTDGEGYAKWREIFNHEVQTNESQHFKYKHKSLKVPECFPNLATLEYYTQPVVSDTNGLDELRAALKWDGEIDAVGLSQFVARAFGWRGKEGAENLIRGPASVLLVHKLRLQGERRTSGYDRSIPSAEFEMELVSSICDKREHFTTDALPEMRVTFCPNDIVGLDAESEDVYCGYEQDSLAPVLDGDQIKIYVSDDVAANSRSLKKRMPSAYDPVKSGKVWIAQTIVKLGVPSLVENYENLKQNSKKLVKQKINKQGKEMKSI